MPASRRTFSGSDIADLVDRALEESGTVLIRRRGRKDLVIMPLERLREMDTTEYLLASPKNRQRLLQALRDSRTGKNFRRMSVRQLRKLVGLNR